MNTKDYVVGIIVMLLGFGGLALLFANYEKEMPQLDQKAMQCHTVSVLLFVQRGFDPLDSYKVCMTYEDEQVKNILTNVAADVKKDLDKCKVL